MKPRTLAWLCCVVSLVGAVDSARAQDTPPPPKGPAEIIKRTVEAREKQTLLQASPSPQTTDPAQPPAAAPQRHGPPPMPPMPTAASPQPSGTATPVTPMQPAAQATDEQPSGAAEPPPVGDDPHANMEGAPPL
ncbi:MAG: hypothetical protein RL701_4811, partial [Pseudomonadota bacterium]